MQRSSITNKLSADDVALISVSEARPISEPLESDWEERAQLDITLNYIYSDVSVIESIESVDVEGSVNGYDNTLNITDN